MKTIWHKTDAYPEVYMVIATLFLTLFGAMGKVDLPLTLIVFSRFFIPLIVIGSTCLFNNATRKSYFKDMTFIDVGRSLFVVGSQYAFFYCVKHTSLFNANTLLNTAPAFILILYFFYDKSFSINKVVGIIVGFVGILLILRPHHDTFNWALPMGIMAGFCWAMSNFTQSLMLEKHSNHKCMFYYYFHGSIISLFILLYNVNPSWVNTYFHVTNIIILLAFAMCTLGFQYFSGKAYKIKSAFHLAPYLYMTILFSWLVDYFILHVYSPISSIVGALLIFLGTLLSRLSKPLFSYFQLRLKIKNKEKQHTSFQ